MKKLALIIPVLLFFACDKVKNPIENLSSFQPPANENCVSPHIVKTNSLTMNFRKVLVEDYTGHTCGNCPRAAENAETIIQRHKDSVVVLAIHAGNQFSPPYLPYYPEDFRTPTGTDWDTYFGMSAAGLPRGCVNRSQIPFPQPRTTWSVTVDALLDNPQDVKMLLTTTLDTSKMLVNIKVKTTFLTSLNHNVSLCIVVAEDSIVASQKDYSPPSGALVINGDQRPDYVFDHTMRGSVNGTWGDLIKSAPINANDTVVNTFNCFQLKPWLVSPSQPKKNLKHMSIIAFVFNTTTRVILQVEKVKVM